jgi:hypothetical protein
MAAEPGAVPSDTAATPRLLLGESYPIEASVSFHAALLHWLDSLAALNGPGMTAGKTVEAHRKDFEERLGSPSEQDVLALRRYANVRTRFAERNFGSPNALAVAIFEAATLRTALERAGSLLDEESTADLRASFEHFSPGYRSIWRRGRGPERFLERAMKAPERPALGEFLHGLARFYGVSETSRPRPRLILAPVRSGHGTHAQALGRNLLIEVRDGEGLADQVGPIVHENAHLLYRAIEPTRREALRSFAADVSPYGFEAWTVLEEALPTAIAQGVAEQRFLKEWTSNDPWYHVESVDRYAKRIFPLVKQALDKRQPLGEVLLQELVRAYRP